MQIAGRAEQADLALLRSLSQWRHRAAQCVVKLFSSLEADQSLKIQAFASPGEYLIKCCWKHI